MPENAKSDGYKFAVTFLVAITSIIYTIFNYLQNVAVDENFFFLSCFFISAGIIIAVGFLVYILIKGFTMEVKNQNLIEYLNQIANQIYKWNIIIFMLLINYLLAVVITFYIFKSGSLYTLVPILAIIFAPFIYIILHTRKLRITQILSTKKYLIIISIVTVWIILGLIISFNSPMKGQVIVEMKDINYKSDTEVPVTIRVTGLDREIKLMLFKDESGNLYELANINLTRPILTDSYNEEKYIHNDYFIANFQDNGKYKIFINSTNMTAGYYELWSIHQGYGPLGYGQTLGKEGFYLVNKSEIVD
ncbi:MAG: hypothetical protein PHU34_11855 [Candidatus Methanoperedens sp.]|nr:hypothetical protein [Candidatus Methanoperedens sp.]